MLLTLSIFPLLQAQSVRLKAQIAELDRRLALRYGDKYYQVKQQLDKQLDSSKTWYQKTKAEAQSSGTIPLEQKQAETDRQVAKAGTSAAQKEAVIKQQLKDLWYNIKNR